MDSSANSISPTPLTQAQLDAKLLAAAQRNVDDANAIDVLIQSGANPNAKRASNETVLMVACKAGNFNIAKALIAHLDVAGLNAVDNDGNTALMFAASNGHQYVVAALINAGADLHQKNVYGQNALELARTDWQKQVAVGFHLFAPMSPQERNDFPYQGASLFNRLLSILPSQDSASQLYEYQFQVKDLHKKILCISAGISVRQDPQNNLGKMSEVLAIIAEYAFSECLVNGHARGIVMETMRTIAPPPTMIFSIGQSLAPLRRRVRNLATDVVDSILRQFIHAASIPSSIPCSVPVIEDKRAEQGPSKKARR